MDTEPDGISADATPAKVFLVSEAPTTAAVRRYLNALAGEAPAELIVRELLHRAVTIPGGDGGINDLGQGGS